MNIYQSTFTPQSRANLPQLLDVVPAAYLVISAEMKVVAVTDKYLRITGCQRDKLIDKSLDRDFLDASHRPWIGDGRQLLESLRRVRDTKQRHRFLVREKRWDQEGLTATSRRLWRATSSPICDDRGNLISIFHHLESVNDLTGTKVARQFVRRAIAIQEEDRARIARELHDQMAQYLAAMTLELESLKTQTNPAALQTGVEHIQDLIEHVGEDVHRLTWGLRPAPIEEVGFRNSLLACVEELSAHSSLQSFFHSNLTVEDRFAPTVETICYRFIQEALANIVKHAQATSVSVIVTRNESELDVIVEDDGVGFEVDERDAGKVNHNHIGLRGMRERMALIGGKLHIESNASRGTSLFARIPLNQSGAS